MALVHPKSREVSSGNTNAEPEVEHDIRETLASHRRPHARQQWVDINGSRVNSADLEPRGTPPYLLIMDLAFSGLFSQLGLAIRDYPNYDLAGVGLFFMVYLPCAWLWLFVSNLLNRCDAEDMRFEISLSIINACVLALAFRAEDCLLDGIATAPSHHTAAGQSTTLDGFNGCRVFVLAFCSARLVVLLFCAYIAMFVKELRSEFLLALLSFCLTTPFLLVARFGDSARLSSRVPPVFLSVFVVDMVGTCAHFVVLHCQQPRLCWHTGTQAYMRTGCGQHQCIAHAPPPTCRRHSILGQFCFQG